MCACSVWGGGLEVDGTTERSGGPCWDRALAALSGGNVPRDACKSGDMTVKYHKISYNGVCSPKLRPGFFYEFIMGAPWLHLSVDSGSSLINTFIYKV